MRTALVVALIAALCLLTLAALAAKGGGSAVVTRSLSGMEGLT